ncbi:MAG: ADP-L-glycero-D-mannoheptose-6-epimerase [Caulobacteraceae bacterium]|jgi:ADP-L-glycero-D-manno-heptose 6-epimerase|nr:ADP-L-glycero-D-mannoheptose-6-epimerase [Caulobacteraceae bacterium]
MAGSAILVTGGAGFIGSNIVADLTAEGREVIVCDRLRAAAAGKWRNLAKHPIADLLAPEELFSWLDKNGSALDMIIHMGAISSTLEPDADRIFSNNYGLSRDLFRWCAASGTRLVYASSAATYGDGELGFDDAQDLESLAALRPLNPYGWSKALFDVFAARAAALGRAPPQWTGLKFFNVYGPNEAHKASMRSVVSQIWPMVRLGERVRLFRSYRVDYEDGGQMRDFVYVRDVAACVAWLVRTPGVCGVFNLGSGRARSFADLAQAVFAAAGQPTHIEYIDMPEGLRDAYQYFTEARMDRLRAAGWNDPATSLEDGVMDYVRRYLARPDPYR